MRFLVAALVMMAMVATVSAKAVRPSEEQYQYLFTKFVQQHSKQYETEEFFQRYKVFKNNLNTIMDHNAGNHSYTLAMNEFGDMTNAEFKAKYTGLKKQKNPYMRSLVAVAEKLDASAPASLDWRDASKNPKNLVAVTAIKNQQQCGSCYAFSAIGAIEGAWAIAGNTLTSLSEQQIVDCSQDYGNQGCDGGLMDNVFEYVIANKGVCSEEAYPYQAQDGTCQSSQCTAAASIKGYTDVPQSQESAMIPAVTNGPVSVAIEADQDIFQFYSGGVFDNPQCGTNLDHGVLVVGWGTDSGKDYWIVKNSWGESWGESGYIRMARNVDECGIAMMPSQPTA